MSNIPVDDAGRVRRSRLIFRSHPNLRVPLVPLFGHDQLRQRLLGAVDNGSLPASLLLHGPRGIGKQRLALWLGQALLCSSESSRPCGACMHCRFGNTLTHPDLHWVFPRPRLKDGDPSPEDVREDYAEAIAERVEQHGLYGPSSGTEGIYVATVRMIVRTAVMSPAMARRKVFVIGDAERMVPQEGVEAAANAFLKLLEEPPADTTLILTACEPGALLPTIRSRVVALRVAPLSDTVVRAFVEDTTVRARLREDGSSEAVDELVRAAAGAPGRLFNRESWSEATLQAQRLLEAAAAGDRGARYRVAFLQGSSRARGSFSETLEALETLLHRRAESAAVAGDESAAVGAARAMALVERAKEQAAGNVSPQLLSAGLLRDLAGLLQ